MTDLSAWLDARRSSVEESLRRFLPSVAEPPTRLHEAMTYSVMAGGKRIRPLLAIAAAEACGATAQAVMPSACALELIHTYSLIHDDLPCMDNDDLRRGVPTNHKVFGETLSLLAGDALLAHAFKLIGENAKVEGVAPAAVAEVTALVGEAASSLGMVGGQAADWMAEGRNVSEAEVLFIHRKKTGALIRASVMTGAIFGGANGDVRTALSSYGETLGLLFQIVDDVLNVEGDPVALGKAAGSDAARRKATYPSVAGLVPAKARAEALLGEARGALAALNGRSGVLAGIAEFTLTRAS
ncbi:MAG: polyprenyl synthetase family protein [Candidatus Coatesbacteria bacterium]